MLKSIIYLAGGMENAGAAGKEWRDELTPHLIQLGYKVWNPYIEQSNLGITVSELLDLKRTDFDKYRDFCKKIVQYDIEELKLCRAVAVKIDQSVLNGAGTFGELTLCAYLDIPVYAWVDLPGGIYDVPSWAVGCLLNWTSNKEAFYNMIPPAG